MPRRRLLWTLQGILLFGWTAAALWFAGLPAALEAGWFDARIARALEEALGAPVTFQSVRLPERRQIVLRNVEIRRGDGVFRRIRIAEARLRLDRAFPFGAPDFVELDAPEITIPTGGFSGSRPGPPRPGPRLEARNARVVLEGPHARHEIAVPSARAWFEDGAWRAEVDATAGSWSARATARWGVERTEATIAMNGPLADALGPFWPDGAPGLAARTAQWDGETLRLGHVEAAGGPAVLSSARAGAITWHRASGGIRIEDFSARVDLDRLLEGPPADVPERLPQMDCDGGRIVCVVRGRIYQVAPLALRVRPAGSGWSLDMEGRLRARVPGEIRVHAERTPAGVAWTARGSGSLYDTWVPLWTEASSPPAVPAGAADWSVESDGTLVRAEVRVADIRWPADYEPWLEAVAHAELRRADAGAWTGTARLHIEKRHPLDLEFARLGIRTDPVRIEADGGRLRTADRSLGDLRVEWESGACVVAVVPDAPIETLHRIGQSLSGGRLGEWSADGRIRAQIRADPGAGRVEVEAGSLGDVTVRADGAEVWTAIREATGTFEARRLQWRALLDAPDVIAPEASFSLPGDVRLEGSYDGVSWAVQADAGAAGRWDVRVRREGGRTVAAKGVDAAFAYAALRPWIDMPPADVEGELAVEWMAPGEEWWPPASGRVRGTVHRWQTDHVSVEDARFDLPLTDGNGFVEVRSARIAHAGVEPLRLSVERRAGRFEAAGPVKARAYDGEIAVREIVLETAGRLRAVGEVRGCSLEAFGRAFGLKRFPRGALIGPLRVEADGDEVRMVGPLEGPFAEGRLRLDSVRFGGWRGRGTRFGIAGSFHGVSLEALTRDLTEFGLATGVVRGAFDMELYRTGEPIRVALEAELDSESDMREPPRLDLPAVRSLILLLEGPASAQAATLRGVPALSFGKMGVGAYMPYGGALQLRGKYFLRDGRWGEYSWEDLRAGVVHADAREYLLVGTGRRQINVISDTPGGVLPWELVRSRVRLLAESGGAP